jgi:hypothetical protein
MKNHEFYQIYENGHPMRDATFETKLAAQNYLRSLAKAIEASDAKFLFAFYQRRLAYLPVRDILYLKKLYADDHEETVTLVIRHVKITPFNRSF